MESPEHDSAGMQFQCPKCRFVLREYQQACPRCGHPLEYEFCVTYRRRTPLAARILAGLLLVGAICVPLVLLVWNLISELLSPTPGP